MTDIGSSTSDSITVRGRDLAHDLMGRVPFGDVAFLLTAGRLPAADESTLFNAVLVSLADHGLTPSVLAARLTYTGAPESMQGAIAAGLLGAGSVFLGPVEDTARFLGEIVEAGGDALVAVRAARAEGLRIPGLGHPVHKAVDPRTPRLYEIAERSGLLGPHMRLLKVVAEAYEQEAGRRLPINGAGAAGAALADLGFQPSSGRGFALLARTAGLIAHLAEEAERPLGMDVWRLANELPRERRTPRT